MTTTENSKERLGSLIAFATLIGLVILVKLPWTQSLWLDETISIWISQESGKEVFFRSLEFQGQSPLYFFIPWFIQRLGLHNEFWLRLPSVVSVAASLWLLHRIARLYFLPSVALFTVVCFAALDPVQVAALSARPYALALLFSMSTLYAWLCWFQNPSNYRLALCAISGCLMFYAHYLFAAVLGVLTVLSFFMYPEAMKKFWKSWITTWFIMLVLMIPGIVHLFGLWADRRQLSFSASPSIFDFIQGLVPVYFMVYGIMAFLLVLIMGYGRGLHFPGYKYGRPHLIWIGLGSGLVGMFLFSVLSDAPLFLARLYLWYYIGFALLCGYVVARISPQPFRNLAIVVIFGFIFFRESLRIWHGEFWREEIARVSAEEQESPILFYSGLIEAEQLGSPYLASSLIDYLRSPLAAYPIPNPIVDLPGEYQTKESQRYWLNEIVPLLGRLESGTVIAYRRKIPNTDESTIERITKKLEALGFSVDSLSPKNSVVQRLKFSPSRAP
ncbi:MAG: glycosyltransferase family 39 protein [Bdellovibrionales bacterium]|nr:glycosyltransferase family 39 protein [Bdellovibrionales bacterium]